MAASPQARPAFAGTVAAAAFGGYALLGRLATPFVQRYLQRPLARQLVGRAHRRMDS